MLLSALLLIACSGLEEIRISTLEAASESQPMPTDTLPEQAPLSGENCIPSGDQTEIQAALNAPGAQAVLCPNAEFELSKEIFFTADNQAIYTQGEPTDETRAFLKVVGTELATAVMAGNNSNVRLSHVIIDGNRPELGFHINAGGALIEFGSTGSGNTVEWVKAYEPRGWSVLYFGEGDDQKCREGVARFNEIGPAGDPKYLIADGISLACKNSIVTDNTIIDATDGGIIIFGASGSLVANNTIRNVEREAYYGINLGDYGPYAGDYQGTRVIDNVIAAQGALIRFGIGMGNAIGCLPPDANIDEINYGAEVIGNTLTGDYMGYGFPVNGVEDWTVLDNVDLSNHVAPYVGEDCWEEALHIPGGFQINSAFSTGSFQDEYQEAVFGWPSRLWPILTVASECNGPMKLDSFQAGLREDRCSAFL